MAAPDQPGSQPEGGGFDFADAVPSTGSALPEPTHPTHAPKQGHDRPPKPSTNIRLKRSSGNFAAFMMMVSGMSALVAVVAFAWPAYRIVVAGHEEAETIIVPIRPNKPAPAPEPSPSGAMIEMGLFIDSQPSGAIVGVDGVERGNTPLITTYSCNEGSEVAIQVQLRGFKPWIETTTCSSTRHRAQIKLEHR